ncbi:MAG: hypothetical protein NZO16_02730 [Deltaproteobacteria bacterium]|nr:hypothetical protein [Deltaproteobacteria bacterium]
MPIIAKLQKADFYSCLCDKAEFFLFNKALKAVYGEVSNFYLGGLSDEILQAGLESTVFLDYHVNEDFIRLFREKYQYDPAPSALMAFEAANFAVSLLRSVKDLSPENIRNFSYQGKFLNVKFNQQNSLNFGSDFFKLVDKHKRFLF